MNQSRRTFLKNSALAAAAASFMPGSSFAAPTKKRILGIQLYSVRDDMKNDPAGTLQKLAAMGYKYVEHANYIDRKFYGYGAKEFKSLLDGMGLKMLSGHTRMDPQHWDESKKDFSDSWKWTVEDAAVAGQHYVISPWLDASLRKTYDDLLHYMDVFNKCGELCKKSGMKFGYHNHDFEFSTVLDNKKVFDIILQHTDPELVAQQLDIGNLYNGGAVAIAIVMQYPGRFELMHVKDEIKAASGSEKYESTILGQGIVNTKQVADLGRKSGGTQHFIIEQESYQGKSPLDCAKEDLAIMKKWGY
ncbi:TIM barrel protein [Flavitalea sp. BT771]|uniref:sugar phosphate isomerase/epimerase family protein n=1 Tax=Flavitalea sp. BT771 TaxID=3063329 RepID=UPI0026E3F606|nr:TIM barrel protein [Flavitalea sp. BT771]MDO6431316.1 TIM barrel protein [Flavitalea sp. BT771]MDV6220224.1 TIM barrel protein [Flavitalea sp. BT771]